MSQNCFGSTTINVMADRCIFKVATVYEYILLKSNLIPCNKNCDTELKMYDKGNHIADFC